MTLKSRLADAEQRLAHACDTCTLPICTLGRSFANRGCQREHARIALRNVKSQLKAAQARMEYARIVMEVSESR